MATKDENLAALLALLPPGVAWVKDGQSCLSQDFLEACADELADADAMIKQMYDELIASKTVYKLDIWLDEWGLPDECMTALGQYDFPQDKLQDALSAKVASWGLGFKDALYQIAKRFGYTVDVGRYKPYTVISKVNAHMYDYKWANTAVIITTDGANGTEHFRVNWQADQPLARWGDRVYECLVSQIVPAHLEIVFTYPATN